MLRLAGRDTEGVIGRTPAHSRRGQRYQADDPEPVTSRKAPNHQGRADDRAQDAVGVCPMLVVMISCSGYLKRLRRSDSTRTPTPRRADRRAATPQPGVVSVALQGSTTALKHDPGRALHREAQLVVGSGGGRAGAAWDGGGGGDRGAWGAPGWTVGDGSAVRGVAGHAVPPRSMGGPPVAGAAWWRGYSSWSGEGWASRRRIRCGSSQGAAQEERMKARTPRTPSSR